MSSPQTQVRAVPPVAPRPVPRRVLFLVAGISLLLTLAGAMEMAADMPRQTALRPLKRPGGWQRAMVAEGGREVAQRAEEAAWRSGSPGALTDGATILASLSGATGDPAVINDLYQRSLALANSALQQSPATAQTHFIAGAVSAALDSGSLEASRHLARAASLDPHSASLRQRIGMVELQRGRTEEAAAHFRVALAADFRMARPLYQALATLQASLEASQATPATPRAQVALGTWLDENEDAVAAEAAFRRALQVAETEGEAGVSLWSYRQLYWHLMRHGRFAEAENLAAVRESTGDDAAPESRAVLLYDRGIALLRLQRPEDAVSVLAEAAVIRSDSIRYQHAHASALAAAGHHGKAAEIWQRALALPRRTQADRQFEIPMRLDRGRSLAASGKRREGLEEIRWVLMVQPDNPAARALAEELAYE